MHLTLTYGVEAQGAGEILGGFLVLGFLTLSRCSLHFSQKMGVLRDSADMISSGLEGDALCLLPPDG